MSRAKIMDWWQQRAPREHYVLVTGAVLLLFTIIYLLIEPVVQQRQQIEARIPLMRDDLAWMQARTAEIGQLRGNTGPAGTGKAVLSIALVEELLRSTGVHAQLSELRPAQGDAVMIRFNQVSYAQLMEFLMQLHSRTAARVSLASIARLDEQAGKVEASLTLAPDIK